MASNGRQIVLAILMDANSPSPLTESISFWPESESYLSSTEYFRWMVTNELIDASFEIFGGAGVPAYRGLDPDLFLPEHNAWAITANIKQTARNSTPVMMTRNGILENGLLSDIPMVDPEVQPFGDKTLIVVRYGGSVEPIRRVELTQDSFNAVAADNPVLYPEELALE